MADTTVGVRLTADGSQAIGTVKNLKTELVLAQKEVIAMSEKFGIMSKEAAAAAQKAAGLKDAIGDAKSLVDAFNPDTKFKAFGASINTVVGGFTALQGVMGLIGVESEETQKALLKVQSALAISQGFAQLQEGVQTFKNLGAVIQATTIFKKADNVITAIATTLMRLFGVSTVATAGSMKTLKIAIASTGIGLLVIALIAVADAMGAFSDETESAADAQERLKKQIDQVNESLGVQGKFFSNEEKLELARAKRIGASEAEIFAIQQKYRHLNYDATLAAYEKIKNVDADEAAKLLQQLKEQNIAGQVAQLDFDTKQNEQRLAKAKDLDEKLRKQREVARKELIQEAIDEQTRKSQIGLNKIEGLNIEIPKSVEQIQIENTVAAAHIALEEKGKIFLAESDLRSKAYTDIKDKAKDEMLLEQAKFENRQKLAELSSQLLRSLTSLVGEQTAAGKVMAIAAATIDTYKGAAAALGSGPPPFNFIQMAAVIVAGIANIKKIISVKVPGSSGGAAPNLSVAAPLAPQKAQTETTTLDQNSINALGSATTRAYVVEADVSNNQEKVRRLNRAARIA